MVVPVSLTESTALMVYPSSIQYGWCESWKRRKNNPRMTSKNRDIEKFFFDVSTNVYD